MYIKHNFKAILYFNYPILSYLILMIVEKVCLETKNRLIIWIVFCN